MEACDSSLPWQNHGDQCYPYPIYYLLLTHPMYVPEKLKIFLQPLRDFLWRNKPEEEKPWQWGKWEGVATPKEMGGLGIINPVSHALALCAKLFVSLASSDQSWAIMGKEMIAQSRLCSGGGEWKETSVENKLLCPKGSRLKLGGNTGALITKCIAAAECLNWKEVPRYFSNSSTHWSPWGSIL